MIEWIETALICEIELSVTWSFVSGRRDVWKARLLARTSYSIFSGFLVTSLMFFFLRKMNALLLINERRLHFVNLLYEIEPSEIANFHGKLCPDMINV